MRFVFGRENRSTPLKWGWGNQSEELDGSAVFSPGKERAGRLGKGHESLDLTGLRGIRARRGEPRERGVRAEAVRVGHGAHHKGTGGGRAWGSKNFMRGKVAIRSIGALQQGHAQPGLGGLGGCGSWV